MLAIRTITVVLGVALMVGVVLASACQPIETETPETLTIAFLPQEDPEKLLIEAEKIADFLSERIGIPVKALVPLEYAAVVEALRGGHAQIAFLSARPAVLAHEMADAWIILGEIRRGKTYYYSQWYVRTDSGIETLRDLEGKTVAFSSPTSTSGYLFPVAKLVEEGLLEQGKADPKAFFKEVIFSGALITPMTTWWASRIRSILPPYALVRCAHYASPAQTLRRRRVLLTGKGSLVC